VLKSVARMRRAGAPASAARVAAEAGLHLGTVYDAARRLVSLGRLPPDWSATASGRPAAPPDDDDLEAGLPDPPSPEEIVELARRERARRAAARVPIRAGRRVTT
jgi:hypothetical protein